MRDRCSVEARWKRRRRAKIGELKEDCTDGQFSILNPVNFKGDALVQVWMDSRELATISEWLDKTGSYTRFLSEVVKDGLHILCEELVNDGEITMIEDTLEARGMLEAKYRVCLNPKTSKTSNVTGRRDSRRGEKNVLHNIVLSERIRERMNEVPDKVRELQRKAREVYKETEGSGSILDELMQMGKGGNSETDESKNEQSGVQEEDEGNREGRARDIGEGENS